MFQKSTIIIFLSIFSLLLISGCHRQTDAIYLFKHPMTLQNDYINCQENHQRNTASCQAIGEIYLHFRKLVKEFVENAEVFGKKTIHLQIEAAKLKDNPKKKKEYQKLKEASQLRLVLMTKAEGF